MSSFADDFDPNSAWLEDVNLLEDWGPEDREEFLRYIDAQVAREEEAAEESGGGDAAPPQLRLVPTEELDLTTRPGLPAEALASLAPDGELVAELEEVELGEVDEYYLVEMAAGWQRIASWAAARMTHVAGELASRPLMRTRGALPQHVEVRNMAADELAPRLGLSRYAARRLVRNARAFTGTFDPTGHALATGRIDVQKASTIVSMLEDYPAEVAVLVQHAVLDDASLHTHSQVVAAIRKAVIAVSHDDADALHAKARAKRRVDRPRQRPDGMASIFALLPATDAVALDLVLEAAARNARANGDGRTLDQLRADTLALIGHAALETGYVGLPPGDTVGAGAPAPDDTPCGPPVPCPGRREDRAADRGTDETEQPAQCKREDDPAPGSGAAPGPTQSSEEAPEDIPAARAATGGPDDGAEWQGAPCDDAGAPCAAGEGAGAPGDAAEGTGAPGDASEGTPSDIAKGTGVPCETPEGAGAPCDIAKGTGVTPEGADAPCDIAKGTGVTPEEAGAPCDAAEGRGVPGDAADGSGASFFRRPEDAGPPCPDERGLPSPQAGSSIPRRWHMPVGQIGGRRAQVRITVPLSVLLPPDIARQLGLPASSASTGAELVPLPDDEAIMAFLDREPAEVAELEGYGPISPAVARAAALGGTWRRLVTDPLTATVLDHGRTTYRPPAALAELVRLRDRTCVEPGCSSPARICQLDHVRPWGQGGTTALLNLAGLCTRGHILKTSGAAELRHLGAGDFEWTTPTGHVYRRHRNGRVMRVPQRHRSFPDTPPF